MGAYFTNCSFRKKSIFSSKNPDYLITEMEAAVVYKILFKQLLKQGKVEKKLCGGSNRKNVHECKTFEFNDFRDFLLDIRVSGCLKDSKGDRQIINEGIRSEDIIDSLFACCKGAISIIALGKQLMFEVNFEYAKNKLQEYEVAGIDLMKRYNYNGIASFLEACRCFK